MAELWAAILDTSASASAPDNCVWIKQVQGFTWFLAALDLEQGLLERHFRFDAYCPKERLMILTDASPWGVGAMLASEGKVLAWFHSKLPDFEIKYLSIAVGDADSQETLECLALLVALRFWVGPVQSTSH
eukprot:1398318-Amphidinium_carterae.1